MAAGFSFLEAGSIRDKNVSANLLKSFMNICVNSLGWFMMGYGIAYGDSIDRLRNVFVGNTDFLLLGGDTNFAKFTFQGSLSAIAGVIVSGSVAERMNLSAFFCYNWVMSTIIFPVVAHMMWSNTGWLSFSNLELFRFGSLGFVDYAGAAVVHMTGGICGLCGAAIMGPRLHRFKSDGTPNKIEGHNKTLMILGGLILWFGWYAFNAGHTMQLSGNMSLISTYAAVNLSLAASMGAVTSLFMAMLQKGRYELTEALHGALSGCVAVSGSSGLIPPWCSLFIGCAATIVYKLSSRALLWLQIDDPLLSFPIHGACGFLGAIATGLFAQKKNLELYVGRPVETWGLFFSGGWELLYTQLLGVAVIIIWVSSCCSLMFTIIDMIVGLRVAVEDEEVGLDVRHGGKAYTGTGTNHEAMSNLMHKYSTSDRSSVSLSNKTGGSTQITQRVQPTPRGMPPRNRFPSMPSLEQYTRKASYKDLALDISVISPRSPGNTPRGTPRGTPDNVSPPETFGSLASQLVDYI
jgi:Amt family ammonium transporter